MCLLQIHQMIWKIFGRAEVDLFTSKESSHCLTYYSKFRDRLAHNWPNLLHYAFPPIILIPQVVMRIREQGHKVVLVAPLWENQPWLSELTQLLVAAPWPVLLRRDLLSQANGTIWRVEDLQALSISPTCLEFGPNDSKVVLKPRHGYVPKVLSTPFRAQVITLSALPPSEEDRELSLFCPVRALRIYFERSTSFRWTEQLFVRFGNRTKGHPVTKQRLSKWIVDAVMLAYSSMGLQCPIGVRAHSTRGLASSWTWSGGVSITEICAVAGWASQSTFARFYNLEVPALQARGLSA